MFSSLAFLVTGARSGDILSILDVVRNPAGKQTQDISLRLEN
jgi:hypothetical protein